MFFKRCEAAYSRFLPHFRRFDCISSPSVTFYNQLNSVTKDVHSNLIWWALSVQPVENLNFGSTKKGILVSKRISIKKKEGCARMREKMQQWKMSRWALTLIFIRQSSKNIGWGCTQDLRLNEQMCPCSSHRSLQFFEDMWFLQCGCRHSIK